MCYEDALRRMVRGDASDAPQWLRDYGKQMLPPSFEASRRLTPPDPHSYGVHDPLSMDPLEALDTQDLEEVRAHDSHAHKTWVLGAQPCGPCGITTVEKLG